MLRLAAGAYLPTRMTVLRRPEGGLVLHSPLAIDVALAKAIDERGEVKAIVAPNVLHHLFLKAAAERYPKATVLAPPGLEKKVPGLRYEPLPPSGGVSGLGEGFRVRRIEGVDKMAEHVFLHEASRSLLVTDFMFNVERTRGFTMKFFLWMMGAWGRPAQSRMWKLLAKDRAAAGRSAAEVLDWSFDRVVVGHGDVVAVDAKEHVAAATAWMRKDVRALAHAV